ncbi:MAG: DUF1566 domain-containing protein [Deltaproteobacteria bacterium]|nr:DUF1566 domain-containing protein [Deltaproteobacteria bacterium]
MNECLTSNGGCHADATCTNTPGSRTCACNQGFAGDGFTCTVQVVDDREWANWQVPPHAPRSFTVGTDTVTDNWTGLVWQRAVPSQTFTWEQAKAYCDSLDLGGHTDWSLPTRIELLSIVDSSRYSPAIDPSAFPGTPDYFWASTPSAKSSENAWMVSFDNGDSSGYRASNSINVRCVR